MLLKYSKILKKTINLLIEKGLPFAVYKFPDEDKVCMIVQTEKVRFTFDIKDICRLKGFIIAPFESVISETADFIKPDLFGCDEAYFNKVFEEISKLPASETSHDDIINYMMTKKEYIDISGFLIEQLREGKLEKIVLSRVIKYELPERFSAADFFIKLKNKHKKTFVYLFNIPESGLWVGATPETLLKKDKNGDVEIMSLAGTALKPANSDEVEWGEKEIQEQKFVTDYIRLKLTGLGINDFKEKGPETVFAGHLAHLQTVFRIQENLVKEKTGELVKRLHPTPAVCGLSKVDAYNYIEKAEIHSRKYYTGFLGPCGLDNKNHFFVNLRCAEIVDNKLFLYVGGGLTVDSEPEKEWNETEQKAKTLLNVLLG